MRRLPRPQVITMSLMRPVKLMNKYSLIMEAAEKRGFKRYGNFVRKGLIGEGKLILSEEQKERLNARI